MAPTSWKVRVASTGNYPELVDRVGIARNRDPGKPRAVVMSLGSGRDLELPLPDLLPGDVIKVFGELEVTTDAEQATHPGLIGKPYAYAPELEARLVLAADNRASEPERGRAVAVGNVWRGRCTHEKHHQVITIEGEHEVPAEGLPWPGSSAVNLSLAAAHPTAGPGQVILVGENEKEPRVDQDVSGIRVVRFRPRARGRLTPEGGAEVLVDGIPVAKRATVVMTKELRDLRKGEQLLVRARLLTDSSRLGYPTRLSTSMFLANRPDETEPKGAAQEIASWKGNLAKKSSINRLPAEGEKASEKVGVMRIGKDARKARVNVVAVSSAPFRSPTVTDDSLPVGRQSGIEVTRFGPELSG